MKITPRVEGEKHTNGNGSQLSHESGIHQSPVKKAKTISDAPQSVITQKTVESPPVVASGEPFLPETLEPAFNSDELRKLEESEKAERDRHNDFSAY